ncbi:MAG: ATPase, T2SS/T4P/T4SS family, partial [Anaerolineae bacterium]
AYAISLNASDIHIEVLKDAVLVRFRIDGVLHEMMRIPKEVHPAIVARIKLLAGLKIDEHRKPQDPLSAGGGGVSAGGADDPALLLPLSPRQGHLRRPVL